MKPKFTDIGMHAWLTPNGMCGDISACQIPVGIGDWRNLNVYFCD